MKAVYVTNILQFKYPCYTRDLKCSEKKYDSAHQLYIDFTNCLYIQLNGPEGKKNSKC